MERGKLMCLVVIVALCADALAFPCKGHGMKKILRKLNKEELHLFKKSHRKTPQGASCNPLALPSYKSRCPTKPLRNEENDRIPKHLATVFCHNCDPECCAVTYWVTVLKEKKNNVPERPKVWVMEQQEIIIDYVRP